MNMPQRDWAVLATGPSLTQAQADAVRGRFGVIAVSDAYRLAPWADALVSTDSAWWRHHKPRFAGRRFSALGHKGTEPVRGHAPGSNSGALAVRVARSLGARLIVLLGFDGHGSHFFGDHPAPLVNTTPARRRIHAQQHAAEAAACAAAGIQIFNCTPGTALTCYPIATLDEVLDATAQAAAA